MATQTEKIKFDEIILERILDIGYLMLASGGEVRRIEDTISRLCHAYGADYTDVLTITSSIVVTVRFNDDRAPMTQTRRILSQNYDLCRLEKLNALSRRICKDPMPADEFGKEIQKISPSKINIPLTSICWALVSASFALFFGGSVLDAIISALIGIILYFVKLLCSRFLLNNYFTIILCSILGGLLAAVPLRFGLNVSPSYINIGNIMLLISGMAFTTAIRDVFSGDTISGLLRLCESIVVGMAIAWGFAAFDFIPFDASNVNPAWLQMLTTFGGCIGYMGVFHSRNRYGLISATIAVVGWAFVIILQQTSQNELIGYLVASVFITLLAEIMSKVLRTPTTMFLSISLLPLFPGKALYVTMQYALSGMWVDCFHEALKTLLYAVAIAAGILIVTTIWDAVNGYFLRKKEIK